MQDRSGHLRIGQGAALAASVWSRWSVWQPADRRERREGRAEAESCCCRGSDARNGRPPLSFGRTGELTTWLGGAASRPRLFSGPSLFLRFLVLARFVPAAPTP